MDIRTEYIESNVEINNEDGQHLICPSCGHDCLHTDDSTYVDEDYGGYDIAMWCEGCPADIVMRVISRKGWVYVKMYHTPYGRAYQRRVDTWETQNRNKNR